MPKTVDERRALIDAFTYLIADITEASSQADMSRLRSVIASALRAHLRDNLSIATLTPDLTRLHRVSPEFARTDLLRDLGALESEGEFPNEALVVNRRDERERLLSLGLVDSLSGLLPRERLGPFITEGGQNIWFDVFFAAHRMEIRQKGVSSPAIVFTQARLPRRRGSTTAIEIEPGTVWIRGDLVDSGLPSAAFVGIKVSGGSLKLKQPVTIIGDIIEITDPIKGSLDLNPAGDDVTPVVGACSSSNAKVTLPSAITFTFDSGTSTVAGTAGKMKVWGQNFTFGSSLGTWTFIERLWMIVLAYDVNPQQFDSEPVDDDLVHFEGIGAVSSGGLGLPVVIVSNPAVLGETAFAARWFLQIESLLARWYSPDPRLFELRNIWIGVSGYGVDITAEAIEPLVPAVTHSYDLWTIAGGSDKRLPWRQTYDKPFSLLYRCHVVDGEYLMVPGQADVALDRPVTTNGVPVPTPTTQGILLLHQFNSTVTITLGATIEDQGARHQFALQNALIWTSTPRFIFVQGELLGEQKIDDGNAQLFLYAFAWTPSLPDPYVSNAFIRRPEAGAASLSILVAHLSWTEPEKLTVSFEGQLGSNVAIKGRTASSGEPRPARTGDHNPDIGLTLVEQNERTFDQKTLAEWRAAQSAEQQGRSRRIEQAEQENKRTLESINGYMAKIAGPAANLLLLDVSTNQDLLGVALSDQSSSHSAEGETAVKGFLVSDLAVHSPVAAMRVIALPQVQWEPVRTLDADQNIMTMGWFPTPLASATDGGLTQIGARSQRLVPIIPDTALQGTFDAYKDGTPVGIRTTFPFGLVGAIQLQPTNTPQRQADLYELTRPTFADEGSLGGIQITAKAEGGRSDDGSISPTFEGLMRQLLNGVDLPSGIPLGISVLGETLQPAGSVETIFNNDMAARPRVPVTRIDLSGYGGSNFSDWNNPFAAFAEAAKVQFRFIIGRTILEVVKVNSVLHPWGIRVTRSVTIERRPGGGVIRRDSGWQAITPGIFDYRYFDPGVGDIIVAPYAFDAGVFRGLFRIRSIRPAPGEVFTDGTATLVPYYFDADVALEGVTERAAAIGILGYLQTTPNGVPADAGAIQALIETQGPVGGPIDSWINFGGSGLPFRAQRIEVGLAIDSGNPLFVATVRGVPKLPKTGAWSVVSRPVASVPPNGGEAVPVDDKRGVPIIRRYPVRYLPGDDTVFNEPRLDGTPGDYRFADAADLLTPSTPVNDYALLQSTPTHAFVFPRPFVPAATAPRIESGHKPALADLFARSTSKGAFPPASNTIELAPGSLHFNVGPTGTLALSSAISIVGHPTPLRIAGTTGHGSSLFYDLATLNLALDEDRWEAEFTGLRVWSDISGLERITGSEMRIVGSTDQRPQIAELKSLLLEEIEEILQYIPLFGSRGVQGPIDLGASNARHEFKVEAKVAVTVPPTQAVFPAGAGVKLKLFVKQSTGIDITTGGAKASATFGAALDGKVPLLSVAAVAVFLIVSGEVTFSLTSVSGSITAEKLDLMAFAGIGVEGRIGPFQAYAFLGIGFVLVYDAIADQTKYGGLVALEAGVDLTIVKVKIRAELKGLVYSAGGSTKCDYSGSVKIEVDIFLIFSISASYQITETATI